METLAEKLVIAEAEFVIDELFTSTAKMDLNLTSQGTGVTQLVMIWLYVC